MGWCSRYCPTRYRVQLDNGHELIAYTAGKMKKNRIKTLAGDQVIRDSRFRLTIWKKDASSSACKDERASTVARPQRPQFRRR